MKKKLMMAVAAVAAAFGAWADTETIGDYTWSYQIIDGNAEIYNEGDTAISPHPEGTITIPSTLGGKPAQLAGYLDHLGLSEGWMAVFDDDASKSWDEKIYTRNIVM